MTRLGQRAGAAHAFATPLAEHGIDLTSSATNWSAANPRRSKPESEDALVAAIPSPAAEADAAQPLECWSCGAAYPDIDLIRLGNHREVGVRLRCAHFLHQQALPPAGPRASLDRPQSPFTPPGAVNVSCKGSSRCSVSGSTRSAPSAPTRLTRVETGRTARGSRTIPSRTS